MQFDWDDGNRAKCLKHGLSHEEIEYAMRHAVRIATDPAHSIVEQRFIAVSRTAEGRPVFVVFCERGGKVHPISARYMHRKEAVYHGIAS